MQSEHDSQNQMDSKGVQHGALAAKDKKSRRRSSVGSYILPSEETSLASGPMGDLRTVSNYVNTKPIINQIKDHLKKNILCEQIISTIKNMTVSYQLDPSANPNLISQRLALTIRNITNVKNITKQSIIQQLEALLVTAKAELESSRPAKRGFLSSFNANTPEAREADRIEAVVKLLERLIKTVNEYHDYGSQLLEEAMSEYALLANKEISNNFYNSISSAVKKDFQQEVNDKLQSVKAKYEQELSDKDEQISNFKDNVNSLKEQLQEKTHQNSLLEQQLKAEKQRYEQKIEDLQTLLKQSKEHSEKVEGHLTESIEAIRNSLAPNMQNLRASNVSSNISYGSGSMVANSSRQSGLYSVEIKDINSELNKALTLPRNKAIVFLGNKVRTNPGLNSYYVKISTMLNISMSKMYRENQLNGIEDQLSQNEKQPFVDLINSETDELLSKRIAEVQKVRKDPIQYMRDKVAVYEGANGINKQQLTLKA